MGKVYFPLLTKQLEFLDVVEKFPFQIWLVNFVSVPQRELRLRFTVVLIFSEEV